MKIYKVAITENYRKVVSVQAKNAKEAQRRAWDAWLNTEIILNMNDFQGADVCAVSEGIETDEQKSKELFIEGYDDSKGKGTAKNDR